MVWVAVGDTVVRCYSDGDRLANACVCRFFNHGSPWNVAAGQGTADLSKLQQHYEEQRRQLDVEREQKAAARSKQ